MTINSEKFAAANKATVDSLRSVANAALSSAEKITALNLSAARAALEDTVTGTHAVLNAKDPHAAIAAQTALAQPSVEKVVAYTKSLYEITTESQQELAKLVEAQFGSFQKTVSGMLDQAAKSAPAGSESAIAAIQSAINAANSAFGNMTTVAKQFSDVAQTNVTTATKMATAAAKKTK